MLVLDAAAAAGSGIVGRDEDLAEVLAGLAPHAPAGDPDQAGRATPTMSAAGVGGEVVVMSAIGGAPGVGKTALAWAAARVAVGCGWFPGGALWVDDLQGYAPDPADRVWPPQLYAGLLRKLGLPADQVPAAVEDQATVYHHVLGELAAAGRAVLLAFDNVGDPAQVAGLLPVVGADSGAGGVHRVLVTSRHTLAALPYARLFTVDVLTPEAGAAMLTGQLDRAHPADLRARAEPDAVATVVGLCCGLPLAIRIVAAVLAAEPDRPVAALATELADETTRLHTLDLDERLSVRAAFDLSRRRLTDEQAWLFRAVAAVPGPDIGIEVAAAAADQPIGVARAGLRQLTRAHLLETRTETGHTRYRMHDLVQLYAREHLNPDEQAHVIARVLRSCCETATAARGRIGGLRDSALPETVVQARFVTPAQALAWVGRERATLVAVSAAAAAAHPAAVVRLSVDLAPLLERARYLQDWITLATLAVEASARTDNRHSEGGAWNNLGSALRDVRRFDEAITAHAKARDIFEEILDRDGEGRALNNLGVALQRARRFDEAITAHEQACDIHRERGDRPGEGKALNNLGLALQEVRRFDEAITAHEQARDIFHGTGDRHSEGTAWDNLGLARRNARRFYEAITAHQQAGDIFHETADRHGEGAAWNNLGLVLQDMGRFDHSITALEQARDLHRDTGDRHSEGGSWNNLGLSLRQVGRFDEAITAHEQARDIYQDTRDRYGEATACANLGEALKATGHMAMAQHSCSDAIRLFVETGAEREAEIVRKWLAELDDETTSIGT